MQPLWAVFVCTLKSNFPQQGKDPENPTTLSLQLLRAEGLMMMSRAAQICNNTRTENHAHGLIARQIQNIQALPAQTERDPQSSQTPAQTVGTIKGWKIGYLSETFSFSCLSQVKLSVFKHHSPWFKVIAKVMIHKAGMVQPSAFRFLPSALFPQQDTINSSRSGEFNRNPL